MKDHALIRRIARQIDPDVYARTRASPPDGFLGTAEWWAVARETRRIDAAKQAATAVSAIRGAGMTILPRTLPRNAVGALRRALMAQGVTSPDGKKAEAIWEAIVTAVDRSCSAGER